MTAEQNKTRVLELIGRVLNNHDTAALAAYTSNPAVIASGSALVEAFPDLRTEVGWIAADGDMVVVFLSTEGTHQGPWLFVQEATGRNVKTSFTLALRFDADGQIVDQWLGSNFIEVLAQLGWGIAPVGEAAALPGAPH